MKNGAISVVMSVYKAELPEYLDEALCSIWSQQRLKPDEIILVEDGPLNPGLDLVVDSWKNKLGNKFVVVKNDVNLGLTKSLNKGIALAQCKYIARMDSDDISHPDRFLKQYEYLQSHSDIDVLGGSIQEFNSSEECINIRQYPLTHAEVLTYIHKASPLAHPATMIRKRIFDSGIKYDESYRTSQDIALWFDIISMGGKIANLDNIVLYFRQSDNIFKRRGRSKAVNEFKIYLKGIRRVYGPITLRYLYPCARFVFRLMPERLVAWIYNGKFRKSFLGTK